MRMGWAFLTGLGIGAAVGLMFAPQSGKATQRLIAGKLKDGCDQVASTSKKVGSQVRDFAKRGKDSVTGAIEAGKEVYRAS
jgi:gas vesicle protein